VKLWSTADIHPRDRVASWVDAVCESSVHVASTPRRGDSFFATLGVQPIGDLLFSEVASVAQRMVRAPRHLGLDEPHFCFVTQASGRGRISQDGHDAELQPGDLTLTDSTRPFQLDFDDQFALTVLRFPREQLLRRVGPPERFIAGRINGREGFAGLLSPMLQNLSSQLRNIPADSLGRIAENALDLIATTLLAGNGEASLSRGMTHVRVKFWIETHLAEDLSGDRIAGACGLSVRHLNRLFAREGASLMHYVWERRLARCRRHLTDPAMKHRSIGEIALAAGFKDLSHFSRAYRARYGCTAQEDRASS
jgi:AraC family transcriptional regulator, positive regulator of tynA and feaB